jgi:hypothetical protein
MSRENVEIVRRVYELRPGDLESGRGRDLFDPGIEWVPASQSLLAADTYHGHDGVRRFWRDLLSAWAEYLVEPEEFLDLGEQVAVVKRCRGGRPRLCDGRSRATRDGSGRRIGAVATTRAHAQRLPEPPRPPDRGREPGPEQPLQLRRRGACRAPRTRPRRHGEQLRRGVASRSTCSWCRTSGSASTVRRSLGSDAGGAEWLNTRCWLQRVFSEFQLAGL